MLQEFQEISEDSRIWIYQSTKPVNSKVQKEILQKGRKFLQSWTAHGADLKASIDFRYDHFLVIALDESHAGATGCSIDKSVSFVRAIESEYDLSFLDRSKVAIQIDSAIQIKDLNELKNHAKQGLISGEAILFNNLISQKRQIDHNWKVPLKESWLKKYFNSDQNVSIKTT